MEEAAGRSRLEILTSRSENAGDGLQRMCWAEIMREPIWFAIDADGYHHLPFQDLPDRTVINVHDLARLLGVKVAVRDGHVMIECNGRTIVYDRVGHTIHGHWICTLHTEEPDGA